MKLDKIKFARLVHFIGVSLDRNYMDDEFITDLDAMIDVNIPAVEKQYVSFELVDELLRQMAAGQKIPAIKAYRELCHAGLKESKDAVEKYWTFKGHPVATEANLGDILAQATRK